MDENRRFQRVMLPFPVRVLCEEAVIEVERGLNLSLGGLGIPCAMEIAPGVPCVIAIDLGEETTIEAHGVIARSNGTEIGIELTGIELDAFNLLKSLVRSPIRVKS